MEMQRPNVLSSLFLVASASAWLVLAGSTDLDASTFLLLFLSSGILLLTAVAGLLLTQSLWAQRLGLGLITLQILPLFTLSRTFGWWIASALAITGAFALSGPITTVRAGLLPSAPPASAALLMLTLVSMPMALALASLRSIPTTSDWLIAGASLLVAWVFGKVSLIALWVSRTVLPMAVVALAFSEPWPEALLLVAVGLAIAWFAWQGDTHIATVPLIPERHHPKPVFPELAPPEVLDSAGLDSRGRRA